ncbi:MAG: FAD-dependent oxidoreductase [Thermoleophilia bacterium]
MSSTDRAMVIVGGGLAGARAAEALRDEGFDGPVVIVGDEPARPYQRPPLSKEYLRGEAGRETLDVHTADHHRDRGIEVRTSAPVEAIDVAAREVVLAGGERLPYLAVLLATGAAPRTLPVPGADLDGVVVLRTVAHAEALRARLGAGGRLAVVGAGWIGSEVAASARGMGLEVTLIEQTAVPLERVLGAEVGAVFRDLHTDHGVRFLGGVAVAGFEGGRSVERVRLADGTTVECDTVLVGVGVRPRTELAAAAGLRVDDGVVVDQHLRSSVPEVFAAGDVASAWHPFYRRHIRVEHWGNALHQGPAAARAMLGQSTPYERLPRFFSDQYDVAMEYTGHATDWDRVVFRGDRAERAFMAFWLRDGLVHAGMSVNVPDAIGHVQELILAGCRVDPVRLADPGVALTDLLPTGSAT